MPSAARRHEERWKPNISERLKQSQRDKRAQKRKVQEARKRPFVPRAAFTPNRFITSVNFLRDVTSTSVMDLGPRLQSSGMDNLEVRLRTTNGDEIVQVMNGTEPLITQIRTNAHSLLGLPMNQDTLRDIMSINNAVYRQWVTTSNTSAATTVANIGTPWYILNRVHHEWGQWTSNQVSVGWNNRGWGPRIEVVESEADKKRRRDLEEAYRRQLDEDTRRYAKEAEEKAAAEKKAMSLLLSCLTREQQDSLMQKEFFYVLAKSGRKYRIDKGTHGNVKVVDHQNTTIESLCIQPNGVPVGDSMLAQKFMIEHAEEQFRRHANITLYKEGRRGTVLYGVGGLLDATKLAKVIPISKAA